ncbi:tetratricopeptide repeat protein [Altericroceibacterium spongiae]|nr:tetratricopeptide repeat protein [Altericroceibacterium spongiae]
MRYTPAAIALSLLVAVTASVGYAGDYKPDPQAEKLLSQGQARLEQGEVQGAIDMFEAALAVDPGYTKAYIEMGEAARKQDLQGKAIHYYRVAMGKDPDNLSAISGEGEALVEKGAVEKAKRNLSKLESLCGTGCTQTEQLAAAIERGPKPSVMTAEAVDPDKDVAQN